MSPTYHTKKIIFPVPNKEKSQTDTEKKSQNLSRLTEDEYLETGKVSVHDQFIFFLTMALHNFISFEALISVCLITISLKPCSVIYLHRLFR